MALTKVVGELIDIGDLDISNVGSIQLDSIAGDADSNTSITFSGSDVITIATGGSGRLTIGDGALSPVTDNQIDLGTSSLEFKDAYFDGTVTSDAFAGPLTGDVTGNVSGTAATVTGAAQTNITSLGTLTGLTVDNITLNASSITSDTNLTMDVTGDINLDAGGNEIKLKTNGTEWGQIYNSSNDLAIYSSVSDQDIKLQGNDGGSTITALTLDMSDAGTATFNNDIKVADDNNYYAGSSNELAIYHTGSGNSIISHSTSASGAMYIDAGGTLNIRNSTGGGENMIVAAGDGAVTLYYDNAAKLATVSGGVDVTGYLASDALASPDGTQVLYVANTGRVGVGTASPATALHISSADNQPLRVESTDAYSGIELKDNGSATLPPLISALSDDFIFYGGHASARPEIMRMDSSTGKSSFNGSVVIAKNGKVLEIADAAIQWYSAETSDYKSALFRADDYSFKNAGNTVIATITSAGAVGIGTGGPDGILHLDEGAADDCRLICETHAAGDSMILFTQGNAGPAWGVGLDASATDGLSFAYSGSGYPSLTTGNKATIDTSGHFKNIGKIGVLGASTTEMSMASGSNGDQTVVWRWGANSGNTVGYFIDDDNAGVYMNSGSTSWSAHSDERVKENITSLGTVMPDLKNIRCVKYNRIGNSETKIGFIAQDWETSSFSEVVDEDDGFVIESDGTVGAAYKSESTTILKGISYTETIPVLLKAIQELEARIATLEG